MIPQQIQNIIEQELNARIVHQQSVHGGDINQAAKVELESGKSFFIKWNDSAPGTMFEAEAKGLALLRSAQTSLKIPSVALQKDSFLVLEWVPEGKRGNDNSYQFGVELAKLHQTTHNSFGLDHDNFIGRLPQSNTEHATWPDFYAIERIEPQIKMGVESGKLDRTVLRTVEKMYQRVGALFPQEKPALVHGDLWSGNYMFTDGNQASIYDPAVYYGHREMDLAMTRLFGGFSAAFYDGYQSEFPLQEGFDKRIDLYNLYPILVHANLFGGSYCRQAEQIISRYA